MPAVKKARIIDSIKKDDIKQSLEKEIRTDGRKFLDYRQLKIETNVLQKTNGSARVILGDSEVLAGIKVETGKPFPDTPDQGIIICNAEMLPIASVYLEPGPPNEDTRESGMIDTSQLVIQEGEKVFSVFIDIAVINEDGNLFDAVSYAIATALSLCTMPKFKIEKDEIIMLDETKPLPIKSLPVSKTFVKINDKIMIDPTADEQELSSARLTIVTDENGKYVSGQKGKPGGFTFDELSHITSASKQIGENIRKVIKEAVKNGS